MHFHQLSSRHGFLNSLNSRMRDVYGLPEEELLPNHIFNSACNTFQSKVLKPDEEKLTTCTECDRFPPNLCIDGITVALKKSMLVDVEKENLCVPTRSKEVLQAPEYKERMMIKKKRIENGWQMNNFLKLQKK